MTPRAGSFAFGDAVYSCGMPAATFQRANSLAMCLPNHRKHAAASQPSRHFNSSGWLAVLTEGAES
jgi:hypothetical protein